MRFVAILIVATSVLNVSCGGPSHDDSTSSSSVGDTPQFSGKELDRARATYQSLRLYQTEMKWSVIGYPDADNISELIEILEGLPSNGSPLPLFDGWGNEFKAVSSPDGYEVRSAGADGEFDSTPPEGTVQGLHRDIVLDSGEFVQIPEPSLVLPTPTPTPSTDIGKAKATMGAIRHIVTICEAYQIDNDEYPSAKSIEELAELVSPDYVEELPTKDFWGNRYEVFSSTNGFEIRSFGRDGKRDTAPPSGPMSDFDADIVWTNAGFVQYPDI